MVFTMMFFKWLLACFFWVVIILPLLYFSLLGLPKIPVQDDVRNRSESQILRMALSFSIFGGKHGGHQLTLDGNENDGDDDYKPNPPRFPFLYFEDIGYFSALSAAEEEIRSYSNRLCPFIGNSKELEENNIVMEDAEFRGRENTDEKVCFTIKQQKNPHF